MKLIDSHIHLLTLKNQYIWPWNDDHPLHRNCRLEDYLSEIQDNAIEIEGVVVIEFSPAADMISMEGCQNAIDEYFYHSRIVSGKLLEEEGSNCHSHMIKAIIPWAPIPMGADFVEQYIEKLKNETFDHVKGFRYLLQDKPPKVMLQPKFIESLKWLDKNNYVFDWGIDLRSGGLWQFEETVELFKQVPNVKYIINHLTKPTYKQEDLAIWGKYMTEIYHLTPNSFMKLSGGYSELPEEINNDLEKCVDLIFPWFKVCFDLWGVERTIWASNWPVCEVPKLQVVSNWFKVTQMLFDRIQLSEDKRHKIYYTNYKQAYNL